MSLSGPSGSTVEILLDGISTGNMHSMNGNPATRSLPPLTTGQHYLVLRFVDLRQQRHGAGLYVEFEVP
ncbi:hypothetical protein MB46_19440 (plasmid) [Arthrobacter alpinus]|nr:hypothetical protein MB46_19440 [Arthrobacter alpinus]